MRTRNSPSPSNADLARLLRRGAIVSVHVILHYDSGFPTRLEKHAQLAEYIRQQGTSY